MAFVDQFFESDEKYVIKCYIVNAHVSGAPITQTTMLLKDQSNDRLVFNHA